MAYSPDESTSAGESDRLHAAAPELHALVLEGGKPVWKRYPLPIEVGVTCTVGRDPRSAVALNDPRVSGEHLRIEVTDDGYVICDAGPTNPTQLNGKPLVGEHLLRHGDRLRVGRTLLRYSNVLDSGDDASDVTSFVADEADVSAFDLDAAAAVEPAAPVPTPVAASTPPAGVGQPIPPLPPAAPLPPPVASTPAAVVAVQPVASSTKDDGARPAADSRDRGTLILGVVLAVLIVAGLAYLGWLVISRRG